MIAVADKEYERLSRLTDEEKRIMSIIRSSDPMLYIPPNKIKGGFTMTFGRMQYGFMYKINGWRTWSGFDENKEDRLTVPENKWVDYQLETMFKGW